MWTQPAAGGTVDSYTLEYSASVIGCSDVQPREGNVTINGSQTRFDISNLQDNSNVLGTVSAVNNEGSRSASFSVRIPPAGM